MLQEGHQYPEEISDVIWNNQQQSTFCRVHCYDRENSEFDVQEISNPHQYRSHRILYNVRLNEWWCDWGHFLAIWLMCIMSLSFVHIHIYH